jgi:hypothetical protein
MDDFTIGRAWWDVCLAIEPSQGILPETKAGVVYIIHIRRCIFSESMSLNAATCLLSRCMCRLLDYMPGASDIHLSFQS